MSRWERFEVGLSALVLGVLVALAGQKLAPWLFS